MALKLANRNIHALTAHTRIEMLEAYLQQHDIDILLVQKVTQHVLQDVLGYTTYYNVGIHGRGTAFMSNEGISLVNVTRIPSGRAIAAKFQDVWIVNVFAPSGTARRQEREQFFDNELTYLLAEPTEHLLIGGDFN
jgi:exonuclease III